MVELESTPEDLQIKTPSLILVLKTSGTLGFLAELPAHPDGSGCEAPWTTIMFGWLE
jgi:hypothetical protein